MAAAIVTDEPELGQMIGLRALLGTIRRKRRIVVMTSLVGLIVGASLHLVIPAKYTAVTDLYLAVPTGADPGQAMVNNVSLLQTEVVAQRAITEGRLQETPRTLLSRYSGTAVSDSIMSIKFSGSTQSGAVAGANAVARAFLTVQAKELGLQTDALVHGLQAQISSLNTEVDNVNASLNGLAGATSNATSANQVTDLINQRSADESQLSQLQNEVQQALLDQQTTVQGSAVLDPAAVAPVSTKKVILVDGLSGLIAGLAVGLAAVIFSALLSERPPDRSTVAAAVGAPVELTLRRYRHPYLFRRRRLLRQLRDPSPDLGMMQRRLRVHVESAPGSALAVIAVGTPWPAALAVGELALTLSSERHRVVVVDAAEKRPLGSILDPSSTSGTMEGFEIPSPSPGCPPVRVLVAPADPLLMAQKPPPDDADILLVLGSLDAAFGAEHLAPWVTDAVMVLSPQGVSLTRMEVSSEMLQGAGISLRSVILLGSDFQDDSSGALGAVDPRLASVGATHPSG
jgi:capsular polysaccharide biosynthesis protein